MNVRWDLSAFEGRGYDKGRSVPSQFAWMACQYSIFKRWWCPNRVRLAILRMFGATIGEGVIIRHNVTVHWPWKLSVGDHSWIGEGSWILNLEPVSVGKNSCISQEVFLCTGSHDRRSASFEFDNGPVTIGDNVWLAARASVLRGVSVGDGCVVGATALVTRSVPQGSFVFSPRSEVRSL